MKPPSSPVGLLGETPGLGLEGVRFYHLHSEKDAPLCPDIWSPSWENSKVGCLPVYTLFEFASSQRQLPVSTNRPQERSKARAGEFRGEELRMATPPLRNGRVEIYVDSWSARKIQEQKRNSQGPLPRPGCAILS